jgi:hypothetical protein
MIILINCGNSLKLKWHLHFDSSLLYAIDSAKKINLVKLLNGNTGSVNERDSKVHS